MSDKYLVEMISDMSQDCISCSVAENLCIKLRMQEYHDL